ncbi:MAG: Asp-tRNA(Asn)/Glu-tRNA(Gln) amidotransferase subunit GatC [Anaerolineae bacterium]|nr:Asp-tRNA(Asn)/Glu-tRNA(Gln) amidotransferase subunit GatC [Anaerolineae bacterium]
MSVLTRETVENIAELAKLELSPDEVELYREQLSAILDYVDVLNSLDTDDIPPTASVLPVDTVMRVDRNQPTLPLEKALANAPDKEAQQFRVDAVLDAD